MSRWIGDLILSNLDSRSDCSSIALKSWMADGVDKGGMLLPLELKDNHS